jgi:hypothetical protein
MVLLRRAASIAATGQVNLSAAILHFARGCAFATLGVFLQRSCIQNGGRIGRRETKNVLLQLSLSRVFFILAHNMEAKDWS